MFFEVSDATGTLHPPYCGSLITSAGAFHIESEILISQIAVAAALRKSREFVREQSKEILEEPGCRAHSRNGSANVLFEQALLGDEFESKKKFDPRADRKTMQLCRQVQRAVMQALAGECGDDLLRDLSVDSVEPAGGAGHLLVRVIVSRHVSVPQVMSRLVDRSARLRTIVAGSICRKRAPMLSFIAMPSLEGGFHAGNE